MNQPVQSKRDTPSRALPPNLHFIPWKYKLTLFQLRAAFFFPRLLFYLPPPSLRLAAARFFVFVVVPATFSPVQPPPPFISTGARTHRARVIPWKLFRETTMEFCMQVKWSNWMHINSRRRGALLAYAKKPVSFSSRIIYSLALRTPPGSHLLPPRRRRRFENLIFRDSVRLDVRFYFNAFHPFAIIIAGTLHVVIGVRVFT